MCGENDQVSCNVGVEKAKSQKAYDISTPGDEAEGSREYA
jgi:hypothetical protein